MATGNPGHFLELGAAFMPCRALHTACKLRLFDAVESSPGGLTAAQLQQALGMPSEPEFRGGRDLFDMLVAAGCLQREGDGPDAKYVNTPDGSEFLVSTKPHSVTLWIGTVFGDRLYPLWASMAETLTTGQSQHVRNGLPQNPFEGMTTEQCETFARGIGSLSNGHNAAFAAAFDFSRYKTLADVGGSTGNLAINVAQAQPHMACATYDLAVVQPIAQKVIEECGMAGRVTAGSCDFFTEELPRADVITMGYILHDWGIAKKLMLMQKAFAALPQGGAFVAIDATIDEARRTAVGQLGMSLNMMLEFGKENSFDFTFGEFKSWAVQVGFGRCEHLDLPGLAGACIAYKD